MDVQGGARTYCRRRGRAAVVLVAALALALLGGCTGSGASSSGPLPRRTPRPDPVVVTADAFLAAWARRDVPAAAALTDVPTSAAALLTESLDTLRVTALTLRPGPPRAAPSPVAGDPTTPAGARDQVVPFTATLTLAGLGRWTYPGSLRVRRTSDRAQVLFTPATVHPRLTAATRLARSRTLLPRAPIVDARGGALMQERPVVEVGLEPRRITDRAAVDAAARVLEVDPAGVRAKVAAARPDEYVPVITLRKDAWEQVAAKVDAVDGFVHRDAVATLGPDPTFGRGVLGTVRAATAESLAQAGPLASAVDAIGASGLERSYQRQLAGTPAGAVEVVDRANRGVLETLEEFPGTPGRSLRTTLDHDVQFAAEDALGSASSPGALVAVRPSTGAVLAAASTPGDGGDKSLVGRYPPGSTMKVVTSAALLAGGLDPASTVDCPKQAVVAGKSFTNDDDFVLGPVPFRTDFAKSCNTAFVGLSARLADDALSRQAAAFGLGRPLDLGVPSFDGSVPVATSAVDRAASVIGQGRVLASPLGMAMVAATVASGRYHPPVLLPDRAVPAADPLPAPLDPAVLTQLRALMRGAVTDGSAKALDLPGVPVSAKTGTAEFGTTTPLKTHAWIIGFRGDLAFAVLLDEGAGGKDAGPVARDFLQHLGAGG